MSEPKQSRLPVPLGSVLDSGLTKAREERLWEQVQLRRGARLGGHSEPPKAGMYLPAPLARVLRDDDISSKRSRLWRDIQARRSGKQSQRSFRGAFALGFSMAALTLSLVLWRTDFGHPVQTVRGTSAAQPTGVALTEASGQPVRNWETTTDARVIKLADASEIRMRPGTLIEPVLSTGSRFELLLAQGDAEFSVTPGGPRRWVIEAGFAKVEVVGTVFRVLRTVDGVRVSVSRGVVLVRGEHVPGLVQRLTAGSALDVSVPTAPSPTEAASTVVAEEAVERPEASAAVALPELQLAPSQPRRVRVERPSARAAAEHVSVAPSWQNHVKEGHFREAYESLGNEGFVAEINNATSVESLLSLADAARLSGHPMQAVAPLTRVLNDFASSPHAALSAFTLGRVFLDQLHQPAPAAEAFEQAIAMHPPHALLADCHARLVEAYSKAGNLVAAQRAASRYRTLFPSGGHNVDVQALTKP